MVVMEELVLVAKEVPVAMVDMAEVQEAVMAEVQVDMVVANERG